MFDYVIVGGGSAGCVVAASARDGACGAEHVPSGRRWLPGSGTKRKTVDR